MMLEPNRLSRILKKPTQNFLILKKPDAPIPQFVNAMKHARIGVNPEEVANNLQYQIITGADGKPCMIASFNLDPDPNKKARPLKDRFTFSSQSRENTERGDGVGLTATTNVASPGFAVNVAAPPYVHNRCSLRGG
ncbi:MAG: hypothetical protein ACUVUA_15065 [Chloroflexus sp.]|uniref:hypothetical protein n=1 Tax=Chloroflexus sp. TaxID=1904827 RepID=UPI004048EC68